MKFKAVQKTNPQDRDAEKNGMRKLLPMGK